MSAGIFIIGNGHSKFGALNASLEQLITQVGREALADAGVSATEIDAVFLGHFNSGLVRDGFASSLALAIDPGLRFKPAVRCENACASGSAAFHGALNMIRAGRAKRVLVIGAEKMTHRKAAEVTAALAGAGYQGDEVEAGQSFPAVFGLFAKAYAEKYQDPREAMAQIAVKNHENAIHNSLAHMHKTFSYEHCAQVSEKNPLIADWIRMTDCSLVTDGAAAIVLASQDVAGDAPARVRVAAASHVSDYLPMAARDYLAFEGPRLAFAKAFNEAGIGLCDLHFAEVHDCFTIAELLIYEAMGLAEPGKGARVLEEGTVYKDGKLPVNISGGLKAKGHPVGATGVSMLALGYRQLRGRAGEIQREGAEWGLTFNMGGSGVASYATILQACAA